MALKKNQQLFVYSGDLKKAPAENKNKQYT